MASWFELEVTSEHVDGPSWFELEVTSEHVDDPGGEPPVEPPAPLPVYGPFPWLRSKIRQRKAVEKPQNRTLRLVSTTSLPTTNVAIRAHVPTESATSLPRSRLVVHTGTESVILLAPITSRFSIRAEVSRISSTPLPGAALTISKRDYLDDSEDLLIILSML